MNIYQLEGSGLDFTDKYRANEIDRIDLGEEINIVKNDLNYAAIADTLITFNRFDTIRSVKNPEQDSLITTINDTLVSGFLKIKIPNEYAQRVFVDGAIEKPEIYSSQQEFLSYFKGIYIDTDNHSDEGGLYAFNLINGAFSLSSPPFSQLGIYTTSPSDTLFSRFHTGENSARVNFITHDYIGSKVENVIGDKGEVEESELLYIKGAAGTAAKLYIPKINDWKDSTDVAINKAELVLSVVSDTLFPEKLVMAVIDKDGNPEILPEYGLRILDGVYNKEENTYRFNITFYLQKIIQDKGETLNHGFLIYPSNRRSDPRGVIIANPKDKEANEKDKRIKLSITYTKIK